LEISPYFLHHTGGAFGGGNTTTKWPLSLKHHKKVTEEAAMGAIT